MTKDYRDALYAGYVSGHQGVVREASSRRGLEADIMGHLPKARYGEVLDVGCGQGQLIRLLREHGYTRVSGFDVSAEQVALAHELGTGDVTLGDLFEHAERYPGCYDAVIALDVVEHFDRPQVQGVFQALSDLLKPGGVLVLRTPNGSSPYAGRYLYSDLTHGVIFTERSLRQIGAVTGFASFDAYPVRPAPGGIKRSARRFLWRLIEPLLILPLIVETGETRHIVTQNLIGVGRKAP
jgi:SAM-dependent methyltransferase